MSKLDKIDFLESNLSRQLGWITAADSKGSFVFAFNTAMLGAIAVVSPNLWNEWSTTTAIILLLAIVFELASLSFLCFAAFPRTDGPKNSLIYFGEIAKLDSEKFSKSISTLNLESYRNDLISQCHRNAEIANHKFSWVRLALISLYLSVIPWVITIILLHKI